MADLVDTTGSAFLGPDNVVLPLPRPAVADPILQADQLRLREFFAGIKTRNDAGRRLARSSTSRTKRTTARSGQSQSRFTAQA